MRGRNIEPHVARFQADPAKVRVSIRIERSVLGTTWWVAKVASRGVAGRSSTFRAQDPVDAVRGALELASKAGIDGLDLDLRWTYYHPQGKRRAASRRPR